MTVHIGLMTEAEAARTAAPVDDAGLGALRTERGNLPLEALALRADLVGLTGRVELTQDFVNAHDMPLEATYVFPLPDRAAVTGMRMTADGHVVEATLAERAAARERYDAAIAAGQRASIAEEERPDVFTMRVGNVLPGERVSVALTLVCPLSYGDGEAEFRFPLVVAPRYIPGTPLAGDAVGTGYADDTDAVPDASRITPPVLLPGFPNPVRLTIDVGVDPGGLPLADVRSSLHAVSTVDGRYRVQPGERVDRDFVLRLRYDTASPADALVLAPDAGGAEGTFQVTVLPPTTGAPPRPRDAVLVLDRSGSMAGWKMVAARRAAARIVDTFTGADRFAVLSFDDRVERPDGLPDGLVAATDRHRFRAIEHLARMTSRGGTEILGALREALRLLATDDPERDRVLVLVTDGQVGNEDQVLHDLAGELRGVRVHTVGIDRAVNAGFLGRLAGAGGGRCELVESEDRLDEAMDAIHRRIGAPLVTGLRLVPAGLAVTGDSLAPGRLPDLFPGVPLVVAGRYAGAAAGSLTLHGTTRDGRAWTSTVDGRVVDSTAVTAQWARAHLRDLEDRYVAGPATTELERRIVDTSLRFGVLCRFTAYVAVDTRVVTEGGQPHRVTQPVELPAGWELPGAPAEPAAPMRLQMAFMASPAQGVPPSMPTMLAVPTPFPAPGGGMVRPRMARGGRRGRPVPTVGAPAVHGVPVDLTAVRQLAADELTRLRATPPDRPAYERRDLLADLASRLRAMVRDLGNRRVPEQAYTPLRELAAAIEAGGDVDALWARALGVLEAFSAGTAPQQPRGAFWKRT
jgi:Ca-activated chloride channel family protein